VPTTSHPSRRSTRSKTGSTRSKTGSTTQGSPLKSIRLTVTLIGAERAQVERLAAEKGLTVEERGGDLSIAFAAASPEDALVQLRLLAGLLAPKR
jgi:hypothetical protein